MFNFLSQIHVPYINGIAYHYWALSNIRFDFNSHYKSLFAPFLDLVMRKIVFMINKFSILILFFPKTDLERFYFSYLINRSKRAFTNDLFNNIQMIRTIIFKYLKLEQLKNHMSEPKKPLADGLHEMTLEYLEETKEALADTFLQNNDVWSSFDLKKEELLPFFDRVIRNHLESQERCRRIYGPQFTLNQFIVENGKINSYIFSFELQDYLEMQKTAKPETLELFRELEEKGKDLFNCFNMSDYPPGTAVHTAWGAKNPIIQKSAFTKFGQLITFHIHLKQSGFRWVIGRISNPKVMKMYQQIGAKVIKEVPFEREGKKFTLFFFQIDLHSEKFAFVEKNLPKIIAQGKKRDAIQAKL